MLFDPATLGAAVQLAKAPATIKASVDAWLDDHPEATTTVEDGSITKAKLHDDLAGEIDENTSDIGRLKSAVADLESGSLSALDASAGQVPTADGEGSWDWQNQPVTDVRVNGTSVVTDGVANVPPMAVDTYGVAKIGYSSQSGLEISSAGVLKVAKATDAAIKVGTGTVTPVVPSSQHISTFYGLAKAAGADMASSSNAVGVYTDAAKSAISTMLNAPETVSGTTPSITAKAGIQYICGEVATLDITLPASGCIDVVFESGSTPTVLTITPPTGTTVKWANGFDPTSLDANTTYEINIKDGLGVGAAWT